MKDLALSRIAVIVVNYATAPLAVEAVQSVLDYRPDDRRVEVHLVDNASPGADADRLFEAHAARGWGTAVTLWLEQENHGFGRGNNLVLERLAAREEPPDAVLLLNPDARLDNAAITVLAQALEATDRAGAAGAGILRPDRTPVTAAFRFPGPANEIARIVNLGVLDRFLKTRLVPLPPDHPPGAVDWVSGASVMFRFSALQQVGFFDPSYFLYYEEVDLMRRLRQAGWQTLYVPQAHVVHEEGAATGQFAGQTGRQRNPAYLYQSWAHYFARAYGRPGALGIALAMWPAACINLLHRGLRGRAPTLPRKFFSDHWRHVIRPLLFGSMRA